MQHHTITGFISPPSITDDTIMTHLVVRSRCAVDLRDRAGGSPAYRTDLPSEPCAHTANGTDHGSSTIRTCR
jgi:hypothetical protein